MAIASPCGEAAPTRHPHELSGAELLAWRRSMLALDGREGVSGAAETGSAARNSSAAGLDWLLDLAGGISWPTLQALWLHPERRIQLTISLQELEDLWRRHRLASEPLQYLVGRCPWRDLELSVAPGVLIPRQETEQLPELALTLCPPPPAGRALCWADLGTGSGCLAAALARALPGSCGLAVDASSEALRQAATNLRCLLPSGSLIEGPCAVDNEPETGAHLEGCDRMAPAVRLRQGSWWMAIKPWWGHLQLVVSNPPYIPSAVLAGLEPVVRDHEPTLALDGGPDGLDAIRRIISGALAALTPGGVLLLEHHHDQSEAVLALLAAAGLEDGRGHRDLEGVLRFASARRPGQTTGVVAPVAEGNFP